jgi:hypothetical protein
MLFVDVSWCPTHTVLFFFFAQLRIKFNIGLIIRVRCFIKIFQNGGEWFNINVREYRRCNQKWPDMDTV